MTQSTLGLLPPPEPDETTVGRLLADMSELPGLSGRYDHARQLAHPRLADLPILTKDDFRDVLADIVRRARRRSHGAMVLGSGGTTSAPKLSLVPIEQMITAIAAHWQPLTSSDVLLNYDTPGRLNSSHNFFLALAAHAGAVVAPLGAIPDEQLGLWLDLAEHVGPTALNATQSQAAHLLRYCELQGRTPPPFEKLLWTGEAFGADALETIRRILPEIELHGCYGSTETWVIGHNGPGCDLDTFHLMDHQYVEIVDGLVLVTNLHPECVNPVVRYRIGDRAEFARCGCGRADTALRVLGRDDPQLKFVSILVTPQEIVDAALQVAEVRDVQLALFRHGQPTEHLQVRVRVRPGADRQTADRVRESVIARVYRMGYEIQTESPDALSVDIVEHFAVNERSGKTPVLVKDPS